MYSKGIVALKAVDYIETLYGFFKVPSSIPGCHVPPTVYYIPEFISLEEESEIVRNVNSVPKPKWTQLSNRRLQNWGGIPHSKGMIAEKIPNWLIKYIDKIQNLGIFNNDQKPNHVLVNEYLPGQGIMPHTDGPLFFPTVTTISCGSHTLLELCKSKETVTHSEAMIDDKLNRQDNFSLLLERRSLLILQNHLYHNYLHSISEVKEDRVTNTIKNLSICGENYTIDQILQRSTRISLTIRHVPRTTKLKINISK